MTDVLHQLRMRRRQQEFAPFAFLLKDGRKIKVDHRFQFGFNEHQVIVLDNPDRVIRFAPSDIDGFEELHAVA